MVVNTSFSGSPSGIASFGFTNNGVYIPLLVISSSYTAPYLSFSVTLSYGASTVLSINQTETTGGNTWHYQYSY